MEQNSYTGHVLLMMAPTGSGKGTLKQHVLQTFPDMKFSVSCTTRAMREGEQDGREYHFISREAFQEKIDRGEFLEWAVFSGNLYGTLKTELLTPLKNKQVVLNEIELQGIEQIKGIIPKENRTVVYVDAGSWEDSVRRALLRAPLSEEELRMRKERYDYEVRALPHADVVIDNRDGKLESAKQALSEVVAHIFEKLAT